jgi:ubiquinone/menaquinone biosynthesis C-methylase UbiE
VLVEQVADRRGERTDQIGGLLISMSLGKCREAGEVRKQEGLERRAIVYLARLGRLLRASHARHCPSEAAGPSGLGDGRCPPTRCKTILSVSDADHAYRTAGGTDRRSASGPDRGRALALYRSAAESYDRSIDRTARRYRRHAIEHLWLTSGDAVLDVGCGTGASFPWLSERVGPAGRVVGVDLSPEMLAIAAGRVRDLRLANVILLEAALEEAELDRQFDAALFSLTHDVLQSRPALDNVFGHLRRGGRVAAFGAKRAARWKLPVNLYVRRISSRHDTICEGLEAPWRNLAEYLDSLRVEEVAFGGAYIASGVARGRAPGGRRARG